MGTETQVAKLPPRRGVAMFVVLGTVVVVSLFGYVGLTLAGRDQTVSGDLNDIKSRDEAALAGLQLGVNRLVADPNLMITQINKFILDGRTLGKRPANTWFDLNSSTKPLDLVSAEPDWFDLSTTAGDKSAAKVQLLAIAQGDTSALPMENKDSGAVYVSLLCKSRGRHGDEKMVQATYRVHGVSLAYVVSVRTFVIPDHALFLGSTLVSTNMEIEATGNVYIAGANNSFMNSGAKSTINGDFKWDGNLSLNAKTDVLVNGNSFVGGFLLANADAKFTVNGNAGFGQGFNTLTQTPITVSGNLWIGANTLAGDWHQSIIRVGKNLIFNGAQIKPVDGSIFVGGNAWFPTGINQTTADSLSVKMNLFLGDNVSAINSTISPTRGFNVGGSLIASGAGRLTSSSRFFSIGDSLQVKGVLSSHRFAAVDVGKVAEVANHIQGSLTTPNQPASPLNWRLAPSNGPVGRPDSLAMTSPSQNPMVSILIDQTNSKEVDDAKVDLTPQLLADAGCNASNLDRISATNLNLLYKYMAKTNRTINGYMVLRLPLGTTITNYTDVASLGFAGKMLLIVEGIVNVNANWPHSATKSDIQVLVIRNGGELRNWGWQSGDFAGIFYWQDPPCTAQNMQILSKGTLFGSILIGPHLPIGSCNALFTPNFGAIKIVRDVDVYTDIGVGLPGILKPAVDNNGNLMGQITSKAVSITSPLLRLIHSQPYFEPVGLYR